MKTPLFLSIAARLVRVIKAPRWLLPAVSAVTIVAFLFEGFGIYLIVPLLTSLVNSDGLTASLAESDNTVVSMLFGVADRFAGPYQVPILLGLIVGCIFLRAVTSMASRGMFVYAKHRFGRQLRMQLFQRVLTANQSYLDAQPQGSLLNIMTTETWRMSEGFNFLGKLITHACAVVVFFGLMLALSVELMLTVFAGVVVVMGVAYMLTSRARRLGNAATRENTGMAARISDVFNGLRTVRFFGQESYELDRFSDATAKVQRSFIRMELLNEATQPALLFLFSVFFAVLILIVDQSQLVTLIVFLALLQRMQPHATFLIQSRAKLLNIGAPLNVVTRVLNDAAAEPLLSGTAPVERPVTGLRLDGVRYRYPGAAEDALRGVTLEIPAQRSTALVGPSGSGKSTIIGLVCRQFDPTAGVVTLDGAPLPEISVEAWRRRIAIVPQDVHLFDASLRDNIAYGRLDASDAEIEAAAEIAGAMEFIAELPDGFNTRLGERGSRLSGGQRQRIALARAIIRDPDLLILDEATNALDNVSEQLVRGAIKRISNGRTVLIIAHRLANVLEADNVIVLDEGRVAEQGPPQTLLERQGAFSRLVAAEKLPA